MNNVNLTGIFIPIEVLQITDLSANEKLVLSLIDYYTKNGESKACFLTNQQIAELTGINYYYVRNFIKPSLRKKGLIQSDGVRTVSNLYSEKNDTNTDVHNICTPDVHKKSISSVHKNTTPDVHKICTPDVHKICTQKKEEKKELKKINTGTVDDSTCNKENSTINSSDFWNSWKRFKTAFVTLSQDEQEKHFQCYWNKLEKLYTGDRLEEHRTKIAKEYNYMRSQSPNSKGKIEFTNGEVLYLCNITNFKPLTYQYIPMDKTNWNSTLQGNLTWVGEILNNENVKNFKTAYVTYFLTKIYKFLSKYWTDEKVTAVIIDTFNKQATGNYKIKTVTFQ